MARDPDEEDLKEEFAEWFSASQPPIFQSYKEGDPKRAGQVTFPVALIDPYWSPSSPTERDLSQRWVTYAEGYRKAADRLVDTLSVEAGGLLHAPGDEALVYPVFYLYRHYLELRLKYLIRCCPGYVVEKEKIEKLLGSKHDLLALWNELKRLCPACCNRADRSTRQSFEERIREFQQNDTSAADAGRYPIGKASKTGTGKPEHHFAEIVCVDLNLMRKVVGQMGHYLDAIFEDL